LSRRYVLFLAGYAGIVVAAGSLLVAVLVLSADFIDVNSGGPAWAAKLIKDKRAILAATPPPRIVIVAGSGALFGLDAAEMSRSLKTPVVNFAVHASLVWQYVDFYALSALERGDVLVLPVEVEYFGKRDTLNTFTVESAHALGLGFFRSVSPRLKLDYLRFLSPGFLASQLYRKHLRVQPRRAVGYWPLAIGPYGDIDLASVQPNPDRVLKNALRDVSLIDPDTARVICATVGALRERGVRVIVTPPNVFVDETVIPSYESAVARIAALSRRCGGEFLVVPADGRQAFERMLDTRYHLTAAGRRERTTELVRAFRAAEGPTTTLSER
jgi:hypothetical protein